MSFPNARLPSALFVVMGALGFELTVGASGSGEGAALPPATTASVITPAPEPPSSPAVPTGAEPAARHVDPCLPLPVSAEHYREFLENSPFTRALNLSESLMLTGMARVDGKPVATLMDRESKETYFISEVPNPQGWKLVEIASATGADLATASATISVGGEVVTVRYDERQLKPGEGKPAGGGGVKGKDDRPPPTDKEKKAFGQMVHQKWKALSKEQQDRAKKLMGDKMRDPSLSDRQKGEMVVKILDKVASDRGGGSKR